MAEHQHTNRLINETSPYLLQHAHNPVDWYAWGEEALAKARAEDKPILLSIGYSACHWCHVMERESFEDESTARLMNEHFVNIKVDREERPDLDSIYMTAVQAMTGGGGWPMTVFLTPDGVPFYGGTYFPPTDHHQLPAFKRVLQGIADAYANRRDELLEAGQKLVEHMRDVAAARLTPGQLGAAVLDRAFTALQSQFDPRHGGFGSAPKFPQPMTLEFLLRYARRSGEQRAMQMLEKTLRAMAEGGMYDQLGGGFHRYSVDEQWLVPHFEKMLYDNAQLARVYVETYQATGDPFYRRIAEETLDYIAREMRHPAGGFYSTQDADSEGEEGKFFVWTPAEVREVLGGDAMIFTQLYDVTERGNWEDKNILRVLRRPADVARVTGMPVERIEQTVARARALLFQARERRVKPGRDEKVLTAWNGMALRAFAHAARALGRDDYRAIAERSGDFLLCELRRDGRLLRTWKDMQGLGVRDQGASAPLPPPAGGGTEGGRRQEASAPLPPPAGGGTEGGRRQEASAPLPPPAGGGTSAPLPPPAGGGTEGGRRQEASAPLPPPAGGGTSAPLPPPAGGGTEGGRGQEPGEDSVTQNSKLKTQNSRQGFLEDYAQLADGLLALYEATFESRWLLEACTLADAMLAHFWDDALGGFYDTAADHEALVVRPRDTGDNATPAGNSVAADVLLRLALIFDDPAYRERAEAVLDELAPFMERYPAGFGRYLAAAEFALATPKEIALVGEPRAPDTQALLDVIFRPFLPNKVVVLRAPGAQPPTVPSPLLEGRAQIDGKATAYVCEHYACKLPCNSPTKLAELLAS